MRRVILWVFMALLLLVVIGAVYLLVADPSPTVSQVEQVIPNDRFNG